MRIYYIIIIIICLIMLLLELFSSVARKIKGDTRSTPGKQRKKIFLILCVVIAFSIIACIDYNINKTDYTEIELLNARWNLEIPEAKEELLQEGQSDGWNGDGMYYSVFGFDENDARYFEMWNNKLPDAKYSEIIEAVQNDLDIDSLSMPIDKACRYCCLSRKDGSKAVMCYYNRKLYVAELIV